eukprot:m.217451 g.217451  ORF g.217451 m.217451 type:complete len:551 (+) comp15886_c0_seq2:93-1745(+)
MPIVLESALNFLHGEQLAHTDENVILALPEWGNTTHIFGQLFVTTYKLVFRVISSEENKLSIPLGSISKIEKVGRKGSKKENSYGFEVYTKNYRQYRFIYNPTKQSRKKLVECLRSLSFYNENEGVPFAFQHGQPTSFINKQSWSIYDFKKEMSRLGVPNQQWRITEINQNFEICPTYPALFSVPAECSDEDCIAASQFRSKGRMQALSWLHKNGASISRCSQPRVGFMGKRSSADENLIRNILMGTVKNKNTIHILDARPRRNAVANQAKGLGYEYDSSYPFAELEFLNIQNIHVVRESLRKICEAYSLNPENDDWLHQAEQSHWLHHVKSVLAGAIRIVRLVRSGTSVLVHCSDGWDRTAQLTSLSMLMLDPYYRTLDGIQVLIEKEWLSFGHKFARRYGHGNANHGDDQRSPVFTQFVDCLWQLTNYFPTSFEFNENFLLIVVEHVTSCLFGTFLSNCEADRLRVRVWHSSKGPIAGTVSDKTRSLWQFISEQKHKFVNALYEPSKQELNMTLSMLHLRLWAKCYSVRPEVLISREVLIWLLLIIKI